MTKSGNFVVMAVLANVAKVTTLLRRGKGQISCNQNVVTFGLKTRI